MCVYKKMFIYYILIHYVNCLYVIIATKYLMSIIFTRQITTTMDFPAYYIRSLLLYATKQWACL